MELSITVHRIKFLFLVDNSFISCHFYNPPERIRNPHVYYFWLFFLSNSKKYHLLYVVHGMNQSSTMYLKRMADI